MHFNRLKTPVQQARAHEAQQDYAAEKQKPRELDTLRTSATEILGAHSNLLHGRYRKAAEKLERQLPHAEAAKGRKSLPEDLLQYRNDRAKLKMDRIQDKINRSGDGFWARQVNRQRHQTVKKLAYGRKMREATAKKLEENRLSKPEEIRKKIDELVSKRVEAMRRKAERNVLREQYGVTKRNHIKRANILANMTPTQKKEIIREAILLVRKRNIQLGLLEPDYKVDETANTRMIEGQYERTI